MSPLSIYLAAFALFWTIFATSKVLWAMKRRRVHAQAARRLVIG